MVFIKCLDHGTYPVSPSYGSLAATSNLIRRYKDAFLTLSYLAERQNAIKPLSTKRLMGLAR